MVEKMAQLILMVVVKAGPMAWRKVVMRVQKMPLQLVNSRAVKMVVMMVEMKDLMTADSTVVPKAAMMVDMKGLKMVG